MQTITILKPEQMLTRYSWICNNKHNVEYAHTNGNEFNGEGQSQRWWINEATDYCSNHGGLLELTDELPGIGASLTANVVYQPKTYAGWALYQLGLIG